MKKRIIAAVLAALLLFCIGGENTRAQAVAPTTVIGVIGGGAWTLLNLITGKMDGAAEAIGYILESGAESLSDVESWAIAQYGAHQFEMLFDGWNIINNRVTGWFEAGEITIDGTVVTMSYSQYKELCRLVGEELGEFTADFGTAIDSSLFAFNLGTYLDLADAPRTNAFLNEFDSSFANGSSYIPVYYGESYWYTLDVYIDEKIPVFRVPRFSEVPVYLNTWEYACLNGEREEYNRSLQETISCRDDMQKDIA